MVSLPKKVIIHIWDAGLEKMVLDNLRTLSITHHSEYTFLNLSEINPPIVYLTSHHLDQYVDTNLIKDAYAVVWGPHQIDSDWFKKLATDSYSGERILLRIFPSFDYSKFDENATTFVDYTGQTLSQKIYDALSAKK